MSAPQHVADIAAELPHHSINGHGQAGAGAVRALVDPSTEQVWLERLDASMDQLNAAVAGAKESLPIWADTPPGARAGALTNLAELIEAHREDLA